MVQINEVASDRKLAAVAGVEGFGENTGDFFVTHAFEHTLGLMTLLFWVRTHICNFGRILERNEDFCGLPSTPEVLWS